MFIGIESIESKLGIVIEFGMKRNGKNAENSIAAIFDNKYYQIFDDVGQYKERFVIGVEMDSLSNPIITDFKVLILKEKGMIEKREDWVEVPCTERGFLDFFKSEITLFLFI